MKSVIFAGLLATALAQEQSTVYSTEMVTVTSCAATVTDCPARSTGVSSKVHTLTASTVYSTDYETVTSCAPTVTDCPARSTVVQSSSYSVSTTLAPVTSEPAAVTSVSPVASTPGAGSAPAPSSSAPATVGVPAPSGPAPAASSSTAPAGLPSMATSVSPVASGGVPGYGAGSCAPSYSVKTISTTTVVPTVIYETVSVACAQTTGVSPVATGYPGGRTNGT